MTKNVIVVDEQGNEYGATYPKRAKGLVKNGRARFVDENKICLACPPNENLEDKEMSENTNVKDTDTISEKEVFDQIVSLQKQLTEIVSTTSLHRLGEALCGARGEDAEAQLSDDQVCEICKVFAAREETLNQMLNTYRKMYDDIQKEKKEQKQEQRKARPESEEELKRRKEFLKFVQDTTVATAGAAQAHTPGMLPDFAKLWKTVFLGE